MEAEMTQAPDMVDQAVEHDKKSPQESFAELRRAKDDLEKKLWQSQKEKELMEKQWQLQQAPKATQVPEESFDYRQFENEEFPDGKRLVKAFDTLSRKMSDYEKKLAQKDQQLQVLETAQEFSDFKQIVTAENIEKYIISDEDMREAVEKAQNPLRKAYNLIKKSAAYQTDQLGKSQASQEKKRVEEKESKPKTGGLGVRSEAITAVAGMSNSKMTREQRNAIWAETMAAARK